MDPRSLVSWSAMLIWVLALGQGSSESSKIDRYLLIGCNAPHTRRLRAILLLLISDVQSAIADLEHGVTSRHEFRASFRTDINFNDVRAVYNNIVNAFELFVMNPDMAGLRTPTLYIMTIGQQIWSMKESIKWTVAGSLD